MNKMDLVDFDQKVFENICAEYESFVAQLDIPDVDFIPLSALKGDNVVETFGANALVSRKQYAGIPGNGTY